MCSIIGSNSIERFKHLMNLNQSRGKHHWSATSFSAGRKFKIEGDGLWDKSMPSEGAYYLGHVQTRTSPTSGIHPASQDGYKLFHNGILLWPYLRKGTKWDTQFMLNNLIKGDKTKYFTDALNDVHGSFACVMIWPDDSILVFRNEDAPLYFNGTDISSVKFDGCSTLKPNVIHKLNIWNNTLEEIDNSQFINKGTFSNAYFT